MYRALSKIAAIPFDSAFDPQTFVPPKDELQRKLVDMAQLRGYPIPLLPAPAGHVPEVDLKALGNMRIRGTSVPHHVGNPHLLDNIAETAKPKMDIPLAEKETMKLYSPVADNPLKQLRHRIIGGIKRHPYATAATAAGLLAAGLGVRHYLKSRKRPTEEEMQQLPQQPQYPQMPEGDPYAGYGGYPEEAYRKAASLVAPPPSTTAPARAPVPGDLKVPRPSVSSPVAAGKAPAGKAPGGTTSGGSAKVAFDPAVAALIAGGIGGTGGYMLGKHVISPFAEGRVKAIQDAIAEQQKSMDRWSNVKQYGPAGAAAVSAIILAALAANHARKSEREKMDNMLDRQYANYDPQNMGFSPENRMNFGNYNSGN